MIGGVVLPENEKASKAHGLYLKGKMLSEIANIMGVSAATVRSWKARGKWDKPEETLQRGMQRVATHRVPVAATDREMIEDIANNPKLSVMEGAFCLQYMRTYNATAAARIAGYSAESAAKIGYALLQKDKIRDEIKRLKTLRNTALLFESEDLFAKYVQIANADMAEFLEWGREEIPVMSKAGPVIIDGEIVTREVNEVRFRSSAEVDGTIISEVKTGKSGDSIKLPDRLKAMQWLSEYFGMNAKSDSVSEGVTIVDDIPDAAIENPPE